LWHSLETLSQQPLPILQKEIEGLKRPIGFVSNTPSLCVFEKVCPFVSQAGFVLSILLPQHRECWDYRHPASLDSIVMCCTVFIFALERYPCRSYFSRISMFTFLSGRIDSNTSSFSLNLILTNISLCPSFPIYLNLINKESLWVAQKESHGI
jgi:hypothetical protein